MRPVAFGPLSIARVLLVVVFAAFLLTLLLVIARAPAARATVPPSAPAHLHLT